MNRFREYSDISRLVFVQNLQSTERESIALLRRISVTSNVLTTNLFVHETLENHNIEHAYEPATNQAWQQLNQTLFNTLTKTISTKPPNDDGNLLDDWSHLLISEINHLYLIGQSIAHACQLMPPSILVVKHALNSEEFDTLRHALFLMKLQSLKHIIDWNDFDG